MILRLFFTLLVINIAIFAVGADASEQIGVSDRGFSLIDEGACLNLKWTF
ncbi:hypothetical protein [Marinobacter gelidimuriae]|nr:hypothetical protein [Marinobacter gelidimuriae]